ncbi:MAG: lamin tail domain-containing protein [Methanomassiliicoccales archaeon]|nr:lamin tail domain-containing protein [Methanomassiliicoccales archaeon]
MRPRDLLPCLVLSLLLLSPSLSPLPAEAAVTGPQILITRVCPAYPGEFVTMCNLGPSIDLQGWRLSDGEGSVTFEENTILGTGRALTWCDSPERFNALYPGEPCFLRNSTGVSSKGSMRLADQGDEVLLHDASGGLADALYYGSAEPEAPWNGPPVPCRKGEMMERVRPEVGQGSWGKGTPGTHSILIDAEVEAFPILYPEMGLSRLVREIDLCQSSLSLSTYLLENWTVARHLAMAAARGVQVRLLLEGQPVGGISEKGAALAYYLREKGVQVMVMRSCDSFRRYDYLHAKYMVLDERRLLVSSENMADSSFGTNRGWAVLMISEEMAAGALSLFQRDWAGQGVDVFPLELSVAYKEGAPGRLPNALPDPPLLQVRASASLASSPGGIEDLIVEALDGACHRVLVQQMSIEEDWLDGNRIMDALLGAAERGVRVRVLLDAGTGTEASNRRVADALSSLAASNGLDLEARLAQGPFDRLHNKGLIVDGTVLVGSANWVDGSMRHNRELAVLLRSPDLAETFAQWFMDDWNGDHLPPVIVLPWHYLQVGEGDPVVLDATGSHDDTGIADFRWYLDGQGDTFLQGPVQTITLPAGTHQLTLQITDLQGHRSNATLVVEVRERTGPAPWIIYAPLPVLVILLLVKRRGARVK